MRNLVENQICSYDMSWNIVLEKNPEAGHASENKHSEMPWDCGEQ